MKKFFCIMPMQTPERLRYEAVGNSKLDMGEETEFPILCALAGYARPGESVRVIAVATRHPNTEDNIERFREALDRLCAQRNVKCPKGVELLWRAEDDRVAAHAETFRKLLDYVGDNDELFACMTFGTKPTSMALTMAMQYAYRIKNNATIRCVVYGQVSRPDQYDRSTWQGKVYDMTALIQLDEVVHLLAQTDDPDPRKTVDMILSL